MVALRMDRRLRARIDPSDVLQETFMEASRRVDDFVQHPDAPLFIWLRFLVGQKLQELHRHHLEAQLRDARKEIAIFQGSMPRATSEMLAAKLVGKEPSPSEEAIWAERTRRLEEALNAMDPMDLEVIALRHFEQLTSAETAQVLGVKERAASKRHVRALARLRDVLSQMPGGFELR
jgi:RNA polymerase sigma-70 factor (ECF subfamily)